MMMAFYMFCACVAMQVGLSYLLPKLPHEDPQRLYWERPLDALSRPAGRAWAIIGCWPAWWSSPWSGCMLCFAECCPIYLSGRVSLMTPGFLHPHSRPGCFLFALSAWAADAGKPDGASGPFEPTWDSLRAHRDPEWFRDAKFGIYTHWGPVTVGSEDCPSGRQWYGREMYDPKSAVFVCHQQHFGDQNKVGYKDRHPAVQGGEVRRRSLGRTVRPLGAKFAGPVAVHHDNFAMWDSAVTPWNAVRMGPKRDVTGELEKAIKRHGLKFITTFHHGFAWRYFEPAFAFDGADPQYALLYTEPHKPNEPPSKAFLDQWLAMVTRW